MVSVNRLRKAALSFPAVTEEPHFEKASFRVSNKIFASCDEKERRCSLKLPLASQGMYCTIDPLSISAPPNKWALQGWTIFELKSVDPTIFLEALKLAYCTVAPKKLFRQISTD